MFFDDAQRRCEELELFTQLILEIPFVREVQPGLAASSEYDKRRWPNSNLGQVLDPQTRNAAFCGCWRYTSSRLGNCFLKKVVKLRG